MKKSCIRCGKQKGKGRHYVTVSVTDSTTKIEFPSCPECGSLLQKQIAEIVLKWRRKED